MKSLGKIDKTTVGTAVVIYLCIFLFIFLLPDTAANVVNSIVNLTTTSLGFVYILAYVFILFVFLFIGFSKYGKLRLGKEDDRPEFSFFSWMGMLFGAGLGVGLVFYGVYEPVSHYMSSPFAENGTAAAAADAMRITFFHWSFLPWALYGMIGLCIGYFLHKKGMPGLVSSTFEPMLGDKIYKTPGKMINSFSLIALICGVAMSLGFAATQLMSGLNTQFGVPNTFASIAIVVIVIGIASTLSAISGVEKGIKVISDSNMYLVIFLMVFVLCFGSTSKLISFFFESLGGLFSELPFMMFFMDSLGTVQEKLGFNWTGDWTIMYWAWWVAFAPFVGGFLASISKGRTIREFVIATVAIPGLLCCMWFALFGGEGILMDLNQGKEIGEAVVANVDNSLFVFLNELPFSVGTIIIAMALILTLIITSVNSATFVAGQFSADGDSTPGLGIRAFWGIFIVVNAIAFIYIGGLDTLKGTAIVMAFPFIIISVLMVVNLLMELKKTSLPAENAKPSKAKSK